MTDIYAAAFEAYRKAGWEGVLPLPPRKKKNPPGGYSGRDGRTPSYADCLTWAEDQPDGNICLRLPENVIGIDVDHYDGKDGGGTLQRHIDAYGELPPTWRTTSRADGVSGIRLYRVPEGLHWPGDLGGGIEIIQTRHRYAIVAPSIHPAGGTYRWIHDSIPGQAHPGGHIPALDQLPYLPDAWVTGLTEGRTAQNIQAADLGAQEATDWLAKHGAGDPCRQVSTAVDGYINELASLSRSRHEIVKDATMRLAHMSAEGHRGTFEALKAIRAMFIQSLDGDPRAGEGPEEFGRLMLGAVRIAAMDTIEDADPCDNPFHGLIEQAPPSPAQLLGPIPSRPAPSTTAPVAVEPEEWPDVESLAGSTPESTQPFQVDSGAASTGGSTVEAPVDQEAPPPSWAPIDLTQYLDGTWEPEAPTMLKRTDGQFLLYPGLVHDFHGESESGKSLVAQMECATLMLAGRHVTYIDFESGPGPVASRMVALGVHPAIVAALFTYIRPEVNPYALTEKEAFIQLLQTRPALVVIDGVTDALVQSGVASKDNDDITKWHRAVPRMITYRTGAAVLLIDHVSKDAERGRFAIGGSAKMNTIDGASYAVEMLEPIGRGLRGSISLRIGKDRPGAIRPRCGQWRAKDRTQEAALVVVDSTRDPARIHFEVHPPKTSVHMGPESEDRDPRHRAVTVTRPTVLMERISRWMEEHQPEEGLAAGPLERLEGIASSGNAAAMRRAVTALKEDGYLVEEHRKLRLVATYRQHLDPESDKFTGGAADTPAAVQAFLNV